MRVCFDSSLNRVRVVQVFGVRGSGHDDCSSLPDDPDPQLPCPLGGPVDRLLLHDGTANPCTSTHYTHQKPSSKHQYHTLTTQLK